MGDFRFPPTHQHIRAADTRRRNTRRRHAPPKHAPPTHTANTPETRPAKLIKSVGQPQRPSLCAHTATRGTSGRSIFRFSFVLHRPRSRRIRAVRTNQKPGRSHGRASGPRPMPEAPCSEYNTPAWVASHRQQRQRPTHAETSPARPCSARFRPCSPLP